MDCKQGWKGGVTQLKFGYVHVPSTWSSYRGKNGARFTTESTGALLQLREEDGRLREGEEKEQQKKRREGEKEEEEGMERGTEHLRVGSVR